MLASQPNAARVATEILIQRLPNVRRKPRVRDYRTAAVVAFEAGSLTADIPLPLGPYAVAYRLVRPESGQMTEPTPLGAVMVG